MASFTSAIKKDLLGSVPEERSARLALWAGFLDTSGSYSFGTDSDSDGFSFTSEEMMILATGMATAFVVSVAVIRFLMGYIKKHDFKVFGWYRIVLGLVVLAYFMVIG